jgi:hypothetical protein
MGTSLRCEAAEQEPGLWLATTAAAGFPCQVPSPRGVAHRRRAPWDFPWSMYSRILLYWSRSTWGDGGTGDARAMSWLTQVKSIVRCAYAQHWKGSIAGR